MVVFCFLVRDTDYQPCIFVMHVLYSRVKEVTGTVHVHPFVHAQKCQK